LECGKFRRLETLVSENQIAEMFMEFIKQKPKGILAWLADSRFIKVSRTASTTKLLKPLNF
jgi:hypothetical protein